MGIKTILLVFMASGTLLCNADVSKLTSNSRLDLLEQSSRSVLKSVNAKEPMVSAFIKYDNSDCVGEMQKLGVEVRSQSASVLTVYIPLNKVEAVSDLDGVVAIQTGEKVDYLMDFARKATLVDKVQAGTAPLETPFLGKGVIVGVVDGGLDFTHPAFRTADRSELRLKRVWVQDGKGGTHPDGYSFGNEYKTTESILAAETDYHYFSHGSHVMNIAAGADKQDGNVYYGVASEADLAFSNFTDESTSIVDALHYLFKYADEAKQPMVVNMSLGSQMGPHDGTSLVDVAIDELVGPGKIIVGASGNDGLVPVHAQKTFTSESNQMFMGLAFKAETQGFCPIDIWGEPGKTMKVNVVTVDKSTGKIVYKSRTFDASKTYTGKVTLQKPYDQSSGYFDIATGISPLNNKPNVRMTLNIGDFYPDKALAFIVTGEDGETVHAWTSSTYAVFRQQTSAMDEPDLTTSMCEIGGVAKGIISVGSYNTRKDVLLEDGTLSESAFADGELSQFSNRGPSVDGRMKPDISAPGSQIVSALNSFGGYSEGLVATHTWGDKKYYYGSMLGTSMASPHVAGVIATWLGACPTLTPDNIRSIFSKTAISDKFTGETPNNSCGYGKIDAYNGLIEVLKNYASIDDVKDDTDESVICRVENGNLQIVLLDNIKNAEVAVYNVTGAMIDRALVSGEMGEQYNLSLEDKAKGVYLVSVNTPSKKYTFKVLNR